MPLVTRDMHVFKYDKLDLDIVIRGSFHENIWKFLLADGRMLKLTHQLEALVKANDGSEASDYKTVIERHAPWLQHPIVRLQKDFVVDKLVGILDIACDAEDVADAEHQPCALFRDLWNTANTVGLTGPDMDALTVHAILKSLLV